MSLYLPEKEEEEVPVILSDKHDSDSDEGLEVDGYCLKCKCKQSVSKAKKVVCANGRARVQGKCCKCNTKISTFVKL